MATQSSSPPERGVGRTGFHTGNKGSARAPCWLSCASARSLSGILEVNTSTAPSQICEYEIVCSGCEISHCGQREQPSKTEAARHSFRRRRAILCTAESLQSCHSWVWQRLQSSMLTWPAHESYQHLLKPAEGHAASSSCFCMSFTCTKGLRSRHTPGREAYGRAWISP